jgi:hypothetical protein
MTLAVAAVLATAWVPAMAESAPATGVAVNTGKQVYDAGGRRIGAVYRVTSDGNPQIIVDGKLVTIPASTLSEANGKIQSSLNKADISRLK